MKVIYIFVLLFCEYLLHITKKKYKLIIHFHKLYQVFQRFRDAQTIINIYKKVKIYLISSHLYIIYCGANKQINYLYNFKFCVKFRKHYSLCYLFDKITITNLWNKKNIHNYLFYKYIAHFVSPFTNNF